MNILSLCFETLINLTILLFPLLDKIINFIFNNFSIVKKILILLLSDLIFNRNKIRFLNDHSRAKQLHFSIFKRFLCSEQYLFFLSQLILPVFLLFLLLFKIAVLFLSNITKKLVFCYYYILLLSVKRLVKIDFTLRWY